MVREDESAGGQAISKMGRESGRYAGSQLPKEISKWPRRNGLCLPDSQRPTSIDLESRSRPCGRVRSSAGPIGTMRVGLISSCVT